MYRYLSLKREETSVEVKGRAATMRGANIESPVSGRLSCTRTVCKAPLKCGSVLLQGGMSEEGVRNGHGQLAVWTRWRTKRDE